MRNEDAKRPMTATERSRKRRSDPAKREADNRRRRERAAVAKAKAARTVVRRSKAKRNPSKRIVDWLRREIVVPHGMRQGQPFDMRGWQADWLTDALATGIREAGMSVARKNAKSATIAGMLLAFLLDPELNQPLWRAIVVR